MSTRTLLGELGKMDNVVNGLFGFGALAYILRDRKGQTGAQAS